MQPSAASLSAERRVAPQAVSVRPAKRRCARTLPMTRRSCFFAASLRSTS